MITIRGFTIDDYPAAFALWQQTEGIGLSDPDTRDNILRYLRRNPGLSFVACVGERLVGTVLCGDDGRRGYLHHLAVAEGYRRQGLGARLTARSLERLKAGGITRCHLFVHKDNLAGIAFWTRTGWFQRTDLVMMSRDLSS